MYNLQVVFADPIAAGTEFVLRTVSVATPTDHILEGIYYDYTPAGAPRTMITQVIAVCLYLAWAAAARSPVGSLLSARWLAFALFHGSACMASLAVPAVRISAHRSKHRYDERQGILHNDDCRCVTLCSATSISIAY